MNAAANEGNATAAPAGAGRTVLVLGLGASGLAMARWCARRGARVRVWDSRVPADGSAADPHALPNAARLAHEAPAASLFGGELAATELDGIATVLKSPGLAPGDPRIAALLQAARAAGVPVVGELDLFVAALAELKALHDYAPKLIGVTGTNGKTTTTALTALLVERSGRRVVAAGNIGPTMLDTLAERLDAAGLAPDADGACVAEPAGVATWPEVWVLELSSFQLDSVRAFEPDAAVVLNVTQDHLDWHGSPAAYAEAKARVYGTQAVMVVNRDDPIVEAMAPAEPPAPPAKGRPKPPARRVVRFGLDAPRRPGDWGLAVENGIAWLVRALPADDAGARSANAAAAAAPLRLQRLMPADALRIRGRHNAANALAALALATAIGCPLAPMLHGLREYRGEPHRVQWLETVEGVDVYDDSKGTNVGAAVAAIEGLGADRAPAKLVVILGGDGKGQDFAPLGPAVERHARAVATIGRDAPAIEAALAGVPAQGIALARQPTLEAAVAWGFAQARRGDALVLTPACASLDMFRDYRHRAEVYAAAVRSHALARGSV